jgi:hypothetical protein
MKQKKNLSIRRILASRWARLKQALKLTLVCDEFRSVCGLYTLHQTLTIYSFMYAPLNGGEYSWSVEQAQTVTESGTIIRNRYERNATLAILGCADRLVMC